MRSDIQPGATFPDYELPDHTNVPRRLSELQGDDPLILTLARGHYCPKEHQQHLELAAFYPKIAVAYTQVATTAIAVTNPPAITNARRVVRGVGVLLDLEILLHRALGVG